ncbi:MAG: hypothetical protein QXN75_06420 [Thermoproteota archaeon]|nr:hypothetical protein [Candidatus Brockarchaeota archaeon]
MSEIKIVNKDSGIVGECSKKPLLLIFFILLVTLLTLPNVPPIYCEQLSFKRMLEVKIFSNSTVIAKVSSSPVFYSWESFKNTVYSLNKSYFHSFVVNRISEMFGLSEYDVIQTGEDDATYSFITEVSFRLSDGKRYDEQNDFLSIIDSFKAYKEFLSKVRIESEKDMYDCTPRERVRPRIWYSTTELEWINADFSDAPEEYKIYFKLPIRIVTNLPADSTMRIWVNSKKAVDAQGNSFLIYAYETDTVKVDEVVEYSEGIRYVCKSFSLPVSFEVNRTLLFNYTLEYKVSLDSAIKVDAVVVNGHEYEPPCELWVVENTLLNTSVIPTFFEGQFTNRLFEGWVDDKGIKLDKLLVADKPMKLTAVWREELNVKNIGIITLVIIVIVIASIIVGLRKRRFV